MGTVYIVIVFVSIMFCSQSKYKLRVPTKSFVGSTKKVPHAPPIRE